MGMGGIIKNYSDDYALIETINAGSNIIIQNDQLSHFVDVIESAVVSGKIDVKRINTSALKVLKMKEKIGLHRNRFIDPSKTHTSIGNIMNFKMAEEIASRSITLVKNEKYR